jgi:hypothetical protein
MDTDWLAQAVGREAPEAPEAIVVSDPSGMGDRVSDWRP